MKRWIALTLALTMCAALICMPAQAAETMTPSKPGLPYTRVWGALTHLENSGLLLKNDSDTGINEIVLHGEDPVCLDAVTGDRMDPADLKDGETVYAYVGPAMTLSLPPQSTVHLILAKIPADYRVPSFYEVAASDITEERAEVTATDGTVLTVPAGTEMSPYLTRNIVSIHDLTPGARILVWQGADDAVSRILVFPYAYRGSLSWDAQGAVTVNGEKLSADAKSSQDGGVLLPLRAVAEAVGLSVRWDAELGAVVGQGELAVFSVRPGTGELLQTSEEARKLTGTCVVENGVTYLSAWDLVRALNLFMA